MGTEVSFAVSTCLRAEIAQGGFVSQYKGRNDPFGPGDSLLLIPTGATFLNKVLRCGETPQQIAERNPSVIVVFGGDMEGSSYCLIEADQDPPREISSLKWPMAIGLALDWRWPKE